FHINVDTGMGRMGMLEPDPLSAVLTIASLSDSTLEGVFTHFPASDETNKAFAHQQINELQSLLDALNERGVSPRYRHIANSGALIDFPGEVAWDLVRPGVAMYGMYPSREVDQTVGLRPVMQLESAIVKITRYDREWTVGYGRTYAVRPGSVIGIVPIGYGDGYPRSLSNRGEVLVHGVRVPLAGRVSMDMIAVDLTRLADRVAVGDTVVLMGTQDHETIDALELADLTGTITYEVTCGFTSRIPRIYLRNDEVVAIKTFRRGYRSVSSLL
ncbi:MAG: alanine racemase, partial [Alkalispirochaeta sp.]